MPHCRRAAALPDEQTALATEALSDVWLGLSDQDSEGTYVWYEAPNRILAPVYTNWSAPPAGGGDCAYLVSADGLWSEASCTSLESYVCENEW